MISGLVSVIFPTTGRKNRAVNCIKRLCETTQEHNIEIVCVVDADPQSRDALEKFMSDYQWSHPGQLVKQCVLYSGAYRGHVASWNSGLKECKGEYIVFAADDLWWGNRWLDIALATMRTFPDGWGLVGFNDTHYGEAIPCTHYIAHRRFLIECMGGVLAFPCYYYCANDTEAHARAVRAGRYKWAGGATVRHDHPAHGTRERDSTDNRVAHIGHNDSALYWERKEQGFPNNFEPIVTEESLEYE